MDVRRCMYPESIWIVNRPRDSALRYSLVIPALRACSCRASSFCCAASSACFLPLISSCSLRVPRRISSGRATWCLHRHKMPLLSGALHAGLYPAHAAVWQLLFSRFRSASSVLRFSASARPPNLSSRPSGLHLWRRRSCRRIFWPLRPRFRRKALSYAACCRHPALPCSSWHASSRDSPAPHRPKTAGHKPPPNRHTAKISKNFFIKDDPLNRSSLLFYSSSSNDSHAFRARKR